MIGCFVILFMACYKKTFKETITAKLELNKVVETLSKTEVDSYKLATIKNELNQINSNIGGNSNNVHMVQQDILNFISKSNVNVFSIEDVHEYPENDFMVYTNQIDLEGNYKELTNLLFKLEKQFKSSRLSSVHFYTKKNYQNNTKELHLNLILQNYASKN